MGLFEQFPYTNFHEMNLDWIIEEWKKLDIKVTSLDEAFTSLKSFVDDYFDDLDVQEEINNKLEEMARNGELARVLSSALGPFEEEWTDRLDVLESRMDTFASLPSGSTAGNAELEDIRVEVDGTTAASAGDAVRAQMLSTGHYVRDLVNNEDLNDLYQNGWYVGSTGHTYQNQPTDDAQAGARIVCVAASAKNPGAATYRWMMYLNRQTGFFASRIYSVSLGGWQSWVVNFTHIRVLHTGDDIDTLTTGGWYDSDYSADLVNAPEPAGTVGYRWVIVYPYSYPTAATGFRRMDYFNEYTGVSARRIFRSGAWGPWVYDYNIVGVLSDGDDLDSLYRNGWYVSNYDDEYLHAPAGETTGRRLIEIYSSYPDPDAESWRVMKYYNNTTGLVAYRMFYGGAWHDWSRDGIGAYTFSESFTARATATQGANVGEKLRVMSYNVAHWTNNIADGYIPDNKIFNVKKMLRHFNPDIIGAQENYASINAADKAALAYIYQPVWPVETRDVTDSNVIYSKFRKLDSGRLRFTAGPRNAARSIQWATFDINGKTLLMISTHPNWNDAGDGWDSATNVGYRTAQYGDIFRWAAGQVTLPEYTSGAAVSTPAHTHSIICMDSNAGGASDKSTLQSIAAANGFKLGNGGDMGWIVTCRDGSGEWSLDEIAVSNNVIINNFESRMDWFTELYSDHCPVFADVTLL